MYSLVTLIDLNLIRQLRTLYPSPSSLLPLIADENPLASHLLPFLLLHNQYTRIDTYCNQISIMGATHHFRYNSLTKTIITFASLAGVTYSYLKLEEINGVLGMDIINEAQKQLQKDLSLEEGQASTFNNIENSLEIYERLLKTYLSRLIYFDSYRETSHELLNNVIRPIINNYEQQGVLERPQIINSIRQQKSFNNKLTEQIMRISQQNATIKQSHSRAIDRLLALQNRLMTLSIVGLSKNEKQKIDLLYNYIKDRNIALASMVNSGGNIDLEQWSVQYSEDYLSKLQLL